MVFRKRTLRLAAFGGFLVLLLVVLIRSSFLSQTVGRLGVATRAPRQWFFSLSNAVRQAVTLPLRAARIEKDLARLEEQVGTLTQENARLLELERENTELRKELNFIAREKYPVTVAKVIGRISEGGSTLLVLNRGMQGGVEIGLPVITDGILIGKIVNVHKSMSVVAPLTISGVKTAVTFAGSSKTAGILEGELNVNLVMRLIPRDIIVNPGAPIITSGLEEKIPRGLTIGAVARASSSVQDLFQTAYIQTPVHFEEIITVSIVQALTPPLRSGI